MEKCTSIEAYTKYGHLFTSGESNVYLAYLMRNWIALNPDIKHYFRDDPHYEKCEAQGLKWMDEYEEALYKMWQDGNIVSPEGKVPEHYLPVLREHIDFIKDEVQTRRAMAPQAYVRLQELWDKRSSSSTV